MEPLTPQNLTFIWHLEDWTTTLFPDRGGLKIAQSDDNQYKRTTERLNNKCVLGINHGITRKFSTSQGRMRRAWVAAAQAAYFLLPWLGPPVHQPIQHGWNANSQVLYSEGFAEDGNILCKANTQTSFIKVLTPVAKWP
jgi:hypothetical protein